ncbi:hypothetical protein JCM17960_27590 [Magnetospira thiophila]
MGSLSSTTPGNDGDSLSSAPIPSVVDDKPSRPTPSFDEGPSLFESKTAFDAEPLHPIASEPVLEAPARRTNALLDESPSDRAQQENLLKQAEADTEAVWKMHQDKKAAEEKAARQRIEMRQKQRLEEQKQQQQRQTLAQQTTEIAQARPIRVEQALAKSPPPVRIDPLDTWDGATPPKKGEIETARRKPVIERSFADQKRLHWADDYWTNKEIQQESGQFYELNTPKSEPTGHASGSSPTGYEGIREENDRMNKLRAKQAIEHLGPHADPQHVQMIEAHYGETPPPNADAWGKDRVIHGKEETIEVDWTQEAATSENTVLIGGSGNDTLAWTQETKPAPVPAPGTQDWYEHTNRLLEQIPFNLDQVDPN